MLLSSVTICILSDVEVAGSEVWKEGDCRKLRYCVSRRCVCLSQDARSYCCRAMGGFLKSKQSFETLSKRLKRVGEEIVFIHLGGVVIDSQFFWKAFIAWLMVQKKSKVRCAL